MGLTITMDDDEVRKIFEPRAPSVEARLEALRALHENGIRTYAFIGPVLPMAPEALAAKITPFAGTILIDRMNYPSKTRGIFGRRGWDRWLDPFFVDGIIRRLQEGLGEKEVRRC